MNDDLIKVEGHNSLRRDPETNAVVNVDSQSYNSYKKLREQKLKELNRIDKLENDMEEIKNMLSQIINKM